MKGSKFVLILMGIMVLFSAGTGWSEEKGKKMYTLDEIVVTATKTEKEIENAPGSVTVITAEEMELRNMDTVDDALSNIKGTFAKRNKGLMDSTSSVNMRGFKGNQYTLVLLDGQPLNDAYTGGVEWGSLPVSDIERIEVVRGAASALYGGNAMGGVISIITKTPQKLEAGITGGYGTDNTKRIRMNVGDRFMDKLSLRIGYENESTDGYATTPVLSTIKSGIGTSSGGYPMDDKYGNPTKWVVGDKGKNSAEKSNFDAKVVFDFSNTGSLSFSTMLGRHEYDYDSPNTYMGTFSGSAIAGSDKKASFKPNNFISYTGKGENDTDVYSLAFKETFGPVQVDAQVGTTRVDDSYTTESGGSTKTYYDSPGTLKETKSRAWFGEVRGDIPIGESHLLTAGVSFRTDKSDTNDYNVPYYRSYSGKSDSTFYSGGKDRIWAVFAQDEWRMADRLSLYIGCRFDSWKVYDGASGAPGSETEYGSNTDSEISPKVAAVWKALENTTLRSSIGHAFRAPTLYELYRTWESWGTTYQSNPNLKPETLWAYELGVDQGFFDGWTQLSLSGYYNDIDDLIYYKVDSAAKTKTRMNAGKGRTIGVEFGVSQKIISWLSAWGNFTYTDAEITDNPLDPASENKMVPGIPKYMYNLALEAEQRWFRGSIIGRYFSKIYNGSDNKDTAEGVYQTYEPAFIVDAKITFTPLTWGDISLCVDNVFDKEYYEYYKQNGRTFLCEMTFRY